MTQVFIGGSRKVTRLGSAVKSRIDNIIDQDLTILIGDANGADKAVQTYLSDKNYRNVVVYHVGEKPRNNIGQWIERKIETGKIRSGYDFYATKDLEMARDAAYGFMIWDGKSKGSLNNVMNLLNLEKQVLVFLSSTKQFYTLKSKADLKGVLSQCEQNDKEKMEINPSLKKSTTTKQAHFQFEQPHTNT